MCYGELTPYAGYDLLNSSALRWLHRCRNKHDDEDKSWTAAGREFQAAGPQTAGWVIRNIKVESTALEDYHKRRQLRVTKEDEDSFSHLENFLHMPLTMWMYLW